MSKERLEEIKAQYHLLKRNGYDLGAWDEPFSWLIEQAERVQELEEEKERYQSGRNVAVATKMKMDDLEKQLEKMRQRFFEAHRLYLGIAQNEGDLLEQNKRYREALENIRNVKYDDDFNPYAYMMLEIIEWADKALEGEE